MGSYPGFVGPANRSASYMADGERCINRYPEANTSPTAPAPWALMPIPGLQLFASVDQAPNRAVFSIADEAYLVAGFAFYEVFADGTTIQRGAVEADTNPATISANGDAGNQLFITSGGVGYCYNRTTHTLSEQGVPGTTVTMGASIDGRFIYLDATTGTVYASAQWDGTAWDPTLYAQSTAGDPWVSLAVTPDRLIHLLGETTKEAWTDQGLPGFPFSPIQEAFSYTGIVAPYGFSVDTSLTFIGQTAKGRGQIYRMNGYDPVVISNSAIAAEIQGYETITDATAFSYQEHGHPFTVFTFPTADKTWVVDELTGLWHERAYWNTTTSVYQAYRPGCMMSAFGKTLVGDRLNGDLYEMSAAFYTDVDGAYIRRLRQPPRLSFDQKRFIVHSLQIVMDVGQGLAVGQGSNPQMMLRTSTDGGQTFGNERWASMGAIGAYDTRVRWTQCGQARNRVDQFVDSDPVPSRLVDCVLEYSVGSN